MNGFSTGYTEVLDDSSEIVVPDDDHGLYAIDILDPSLVRLLSFLELKFELQLHLYAEYCS